MSEGTQRNENPQSYTKATQGVSPAVDEIRYVVVERNTDGLMRVVGGNVFSYLSSALKEAKAMRDAHGGSFHYRVYRLDDMAGNQEQMTQDYVSWLRQRA